MTKFKVKEINKKRNNILIEVIFEDGEVYTKRMMVSNFDEETVTNEIKEWLSHYESLRALEQEAKQEKSKAKEISLDKEIKIEEGR